MTALIVSTVQNAWTSGRKTRNNSKGWRSGNAPCCIHNGESADKRGRGGLIINGDTSLSFHCFNCNFRASHTDGYPINQKFRKLLKWLNVDDLTISQLTIEALREQQRQELLGLVKVELPKEEVKTSFKKYPLPDQAVSFHGMIEFYELNDWKNSSSLFIDTVEYVDKRKINIQQYEFYWSADTKNKMNRRVIVPFTWKNEIIGYTARATNDTILPKYIQQIDTGYVYNMDKQRKDSKFVIVCEGVFDAISVDGVAVLKGDITPQQINLIESLDREIIVVPDWNKSGRHLLDVAINNAWSVSFPVWAETCVDINEAVQKYGKLFTLKTIIDSVERSKLKIELMRRQYGQ